MGEAAPTLRIYEELRAVPSHLVAEIIGGRLVTHPLPALRHSAASAVLIRKLVGPFQDDPDGPGGWVFFNEPELHLGEDVVVPDVAGWRRQRLTTPADSAWIEVAPDWMCEILSDSTERRDRTVKMRIYAGAGVSHIWLIDPRQQLLEALELNGKGLWTVTGSWSSDDEVRAAPFDAVSFSLAGLWPLDKPLGFNEDPQPLYAGDR
jgi:Uma2 family endonuclease